MRHDWIFDVLRDLKAYALANQMAALAVKADEALIVARAEIARSQSAEPPESSASPGAKSH